MSEPARTWYPLDQASRRAVAHIAKNLAGMPHKSEDELLRILATVYRSGYTDGALDENERVRGILEESQEQIRNDLVSRKGPADAR